MIKIAISSNINFSEKSLPIIIPSLLEVGISKEDIYVFINGCDIYENKTQNNINYFYLNYNSYEYTPLIEIVEKELKSEYWFLIHDTCKVGKNFKNFLYNIPESKPEKMALKNKPAMSIGSYRYDYLLTVKDKLLSIKNYDLSKESLMKWKLWGVPNEDYILWMSEPKPFIYNNDNRWDVIDYKNWFSTKTIRRTEYYYSLDLYKNKSNWGQSVNMVIDI